MKATKNEEKYYIPNQLFIFFFDNKYFEEILSYYNFLKQLQNFIKYK